MSATPARDGGVDVKVTVTNVGSRAAAEVPQVYVGPAARVPADVARASTALVQFARVQLAPRASSTVTMHVAPRQLSSWSTSRQAWVVGSGARTFTVGTSADTPALTATAVVRAGPATR